MKKIFFALILLLPFLVRCQVWSPDNKYGTLSNRIGGKFTVVFPTGCGSPMPLNTTDKALRQFALYGDSCNHLVYFWDNFLNDWDTLNVFGAGSADGNNFLSSVTWGTGTGILTFGRNGIGNLTVNIDGRYARLATTITTTFPLLGGGDLSTNRIFSIDTSWFDARYVRSSGGGALTFLNPLYQVGSNVAVHYEVPTWNAAWIQNHPVQAIQPLDKQTLMYDSASGLLKWRYPSGDSAALYVDSLWRHNDSIFYRIGIDSFGLKLPPPLPPTGYGIVSGGVITWLHDLVYNVSAATYWINGVLHSAPSTDVTLDPSDGTFNRVDEIVGTSSNTIAVVTGTAANPALEPDINEATQFKFGFEVVFATTTAPPQSQIIRDTIYTSSTVGWTSPISSNSGNIVVNSTNTPYSSPQDIEGTTVVNNNQVTLTRSSAISFTNYNTLTFELKNTGGWASNRKLIFTFYNGVNPVGLSLAFGTGAFGFDILNTTTYQTISIPLTDFGSISTADKLIIRASVPSGNIGHFFIDDIILQGATVPTPTPQNFVQTIYRKAGKDSIYFKIAGVEFAIKDSSGIGTAPSLQAVTTVGATSNHTIQLLDGSSNSVIQLNPTSGVAAVEILNNSTSAAVHLDGNGFIQIQNSSGFAGRLSATDLTGNSFYEFHFTGNGNDTLATLFDIRAATGSIGIPTFQQVTTAGKETNDFIGVEQLRIWPIYSGSRYTSNWVADLVYSGNGVTAYGSLALRENSDGTGNTVTLSPVIDIPSDEEIYLPACCNGDTLATLADVRLISGATVPDLQAVTNVGNYTTNNIATEGFMQARDNAGFEVVRPSFFNILAQIGKDDDTGFLKIARVSNAQTFRLQNATSINSDIYFPNTGNSTDTLATLFDIRAALGGTSSSLTDTYIGFGSASNTLRGSIAYRFDTSINTVTLDGTWGSLHDAVLNIDAATGHSALLSFYSNHNFRGVIGLVDGGAGDAGDEDLFISGATGHSLILTNDPGVTGGIKITGKNSIFGGSFIQLNRIDTSLRNSLTPVEGMLVYDSSKHRMEIRDTASWIPVIKTKSKGITIEFPTASENVGMWKTPVDITVSSLEAVLVGSSSPSVTYNIVFGSDRTSGTNVFTSGRTVTSTTTGLTSNSSFNDNTIPAGSFIWVTTSAQSGTVTQIEITINYTED